MIFIDRSYSIDEYGYIDAVISYEDYSKVATLIPPRKTISSTKTSLPLTENNELEIVIPDWIYKTREELSKTVDSLTGEPMSYLLELTDEKMIHELTCIDRSVSLWYNTLVATEDAFKALYLEDELNPNEIKGLLPLCSSIHFTLQLDSDYWIDQVWSILNTKKNG